MDDNKRESFRIYYHKSDCAYFLVEESKLRIVDLSAGGFQLHWPLNQTFPSVNDVLEGTIRFQNKVEQKVVATAVRVNPEKKVAAFSFAKEIPMTVVMEQHRLWIRKYHKPSA